MGVCSQDRECLFGDIVHEEMALNDAGKMVHTVWDGLPKYYSGISVDVFSVMPNHVNGIVVIIGAGPRACPGHEQPATTEQRQRNKGQPQGVAPTKYQTWRI